MEKCQRERKKEVIKVRDVDVHNMSSVLGDREDKPESGKGLKGRLRSE